MNPPWKRPMGVLAVPHIGDAAAEGAPPASSELGYTPPSYRGFIGADLHITPWTGEDAWQLG